MSIGRSYMLPPHAYRLTLDELLYLLTRGTRIDLLHAILRHPHSAHNLCPSQIDLNDLHVMVGAIEHDCDAIITRNLKDFPQKIGRIEVISPEHALDAFTKKTTTILPYLSIPTMLQ